MAVRESTPLRPRKGGFVVGGTVGFTGLEDEGGLAVEADVFGDGLSVAQVGEEREGDGRCNRRSGRGRPAEIGEGTDYIEVAVFTGDFIECHGGLLLLGGDRLKGVSDDLEVLLDLPPQFTVTILREIVL